MKAVFTLQYSRRHASHTLAKREVLRNNSNCGWKILMILGFGVLFRMARE